MLVTQPVKNLTAKSDEMSGEKKKKEKKHLVHVFLRADSRQTAFGVALKPSRLPTILLDGQQDPAGIVFKM